MSTATALIQDAYDSIGRGSVLISTDTTLLDRALLDLISILEDLRLNEVILSDTVSGTTTTIVTPTALSDELDEPKAARLHLVNMLAVTVASAARANPADMQLLPPLSYSRDALTRLYRAHVIPNKVPSKLLPRGQGSRRDRINGTFFDGEALDNDATSTT